MKLCIFVVILSAVCQVKQHHVFESDLKVVLVYIGHKPVTVELCFSTIVAEF